MGALMAIMMVVMMGGMLLGGAWAYLNGRKRRRDE
jgi:hypothetical protein